MLLYRSGKGPDGVSPYDKDHQIKEPYNPLTPDHKKRLEKARSFDSHATVDACWGCALPLYPIDLIENFRFQQGRAWCSRCVPLPATKA